MVKHIIVFSFCILVSAFASGTPFEQNTNTLTLKTGFFAKGYFDKVTGGWHDYDFRSPVVALKYENGISPLLGIGYLSLGGEFGYAYARDKYGDTDRLESVADIYHFGIRSNYHFDLYTVTREPIFEKLDVYAGIGMFARIENRCATEESTSNLDDIQYVKTRGIVDVCVGSQYYVNDNIAVVTEFGLGIAHINLGATYRF